MSAVLPSPETPFGERVARRLREERIVWLTTTSADGTPQPNPVWFFWDEQNQSILIYSLPDAARLAHIERNPRVSLNFDGNGQGGNIIVITGEARLAPAEPPADHHNDYTEKYRDLIAHEFGTPANFAAKYSVALRITPSKVRGH
ncbi:MAG: TIGR03667 family PPOX class F420-dependent oxidoreductase [Ktedonobacterales bacterium]